MNVGASIERLLRGAQDLCLKKAYKSSDSNGLRCIREFLVDDIKNFENSHDLDALLTQSERLRIIEHELDTLKHDYEQTKLEDSLTVYRFDSISS